MKELAAFYVLVFARNLAFCSSSPIFRSEHVPKSWKVLTAAALTFVLAAWLPVRPLQLHWLIFTFSLFWEMAIGFVFGTVVNLGVAAAITAGALIDTQVGFANSGLLNPGGDKPEPLTASFYQTLILLLALTMDFHLILLRLLAGSFERFPCGLVMHDFHRILEVGRAAFSGFFEAALWLALPISLALLATEVCIAFVSRLIPQMNMLISAAPVRVLVGMVLVSTALPTTLDAMARILDRSFSLLGGLSV